MVLESQLCNERKEKNRILKEIQEKEEELEKRRKERMEEMEKELKEMEEMEKKLEDMEEKNQLEIVEKVFIKYYFTEFDSFCYTKNCPFLRDNVYEECRYQI